MAVAASARSSAEEEPDPEPDELDPLSVLLPLEELL